MSPRIVRACALTYIRDHAHKRERSKYTRQHAHTYMCVVSITHAYPFIYNVQMVLESLHTQERMAHAVYLQRHSLCDEDLSIIVTGQSRGN